MTKATLKLDIWTEGEPHALPGDMSDLAGAFAPHAQHVAELCEQGYQSGEIVDEKFAGWWTLAREEEVTEEEQTRRGKLLIEVLGLKVKRNGRVDSTWGDKTALGLFRTVQRVITEGR